MSKGIRHRVNRGIAWDELSDWHGYRCPRPDSGLRGLESSRSPLDPVTERRFDLLDAVNAAGRHDILRVAGHSWKLLERLAGPILRRRRSSQAG